MQETRIIMKRTQILSNVAHLHTTIESVLFGIHIEVQYVYKKNRSQYIQFLKGRIGIAGKT